MCTLSLTHLTNLDGVVEGQDVHALAVRDVGAGRQRHQVPQPHAEVLAHHLGV